MNTLLSRVRCFLGLHAPIRRYSDWKNSPSGDGFYVSTCARCGAELTKSPGGRWRPINSRDRE